MTKQDLITILVENNDITGIDIEDNDGNLIEMFYFDQVDIADIEFKKLRLQFNN